MTQLGRFKRAVATKRGFVILIVMLLLAIGTAIALAQFTVVANESVASTRIDEEMQARATAEGCLELMQTYVEDYIGTSPPGFKKPDFDGLLDRDSTLNTADDFLPTIGTPVFVPSGVSTASATIKAGHQWALLPRAGTPSPAGCLLRLEDNSDDAFPASSVPAGTTTTGVEGSGRDVAARDRDRSIYITVIGLYPVLSSTTAAQAYDRAHARVTLRRLFATENPVQTPPGLQACHDVNISANSDICGLGGVQAAHAITVSGGSTCGCGLYTSATVTPATPPATCGSCPADPPTAGFCNVPAVSVGPQPACVPPVGMPNATYYMDNKGFANPNINNNVIGDKSACKVYIDRNGKVFVWDTTDPYANDPAGPIGAATLGAGNAPPSLPVHNCQTYNKDPVELPCVWTTTGTEKVTCDFANANPKLRQTPCWKPIANLSDGNEFDSDILIDTGTLAGAFPSIPALSGLNSGNHHEMSSNQNDEDLMFVRNKQIPNIRDSSMMFATGLASTTMCGDPFGCEECNGTSNNDWWTECEHGTAPCDDFHSHAHQNNAHIPWPIVFAWDVDPSKQIDFEFDPAALKPLNVTILADGKIAFANDASFCCASCGTGGNCTSPTTNPGIQATPDGIFISPAQCVANNAAIPAPTPSFVVPPPPPGPVQFVPSGYGYAFKTDGDCFIASNSTVIGDVECNAVSIPNDPCIVGNVLVTGSSTTVGCTGGTCSPTAAAKPNVGVCIGGSAKMVGDIYSQGSVCGTSNSSLKGDIFALGNVSFAGNSVLHGQVFSNQDISLASNATVNFAKPGQILSAGNQGLTSFMETSW